MQNYINLINEEQAKKDLEFIAQEMAKALEERGSFAFVVSTTDNVKANIPFVISAIN